MTTIEAKHVEKYFEHDGKKLPIQTKGNTQGEVFSIYYGFANDLKK